MLNTADGEQATIMVEICPAPLVRQYHTNFPITSGQMVVYHFPIPPYQMGVPTEGISHHEVSMSALEWRNHDESLRALITKLGEIPGINNAIVNRYMLQVGIAKLFSYSRIEPKILDVFREVFNAPDINVQTPEQHTYIGGVMPPDPFFDE